MPNYMCLSELIRTIWIYVSDKDSVPLLIGKMYLSTDPNELIIIDIFVYVFIISLRKECCFYYMMESQLIVNWLSAFNYGNNKIVGNIK